MFSSTGKRCFTIESLVAKENPLTTEDPIRPTALTYSNPTDAFMNGYQGPTGRSLYQNPELVFPESVNHPGLTMNPHQLGVATYSTLHTSLVRNTETLSTSTHGFYETGSSDTDFKEMMFPKIACSFTARSPGNPSASAPPSPRLSSCGLERAFEKNHYVVGAERKQLANGLSLSETQVKVWFQNRRTKYKRQKLEEEGPDCHQKKKGNHHINRWRLATKQGSSEDIDVTSED